MRRGHSFGMGWSALCAGLTFMAGCSGGHPGASPGSGGTGSVGGEAARSGAISGGASGGGAVHFHWTFADGAETCEGAGVETVQLEIGEQLVSFPCQTGAGQVATMPGLAPGSAMYTASGASSVPWMAEGSVGVVAGETTDVNVDFKPDPNGCRSHPDTDHRGFRFVPNGNGTTLCSTTTSA